MVGHTWLCSSGDIHLPQTVNCISHFIGINICKWYFEYQMTGALESCVYTSLPSWKILSALLCTLTEVHPRTYVKQCFLMRSPPPELPNQLLTLLPGLKLTPPTTATTSARSLSPGNCYHHPSFHPWRHLLSARSDYTRCCTPSWATRCLKIKFFVHNNKMPQEFETWDFICGIRLRPAIAVTACTHRISGVFSYWHAFKQGQLEERDAWHPQLWYRDNNNFNFHIHKHIQALSIMLKVYEDRRRLQKLQPEVRLIKNVHSENK